MKDVETWKAELQVLPRFQLGKMGWMKWAERERGNTPEATVLSSDQCSPCEVLHSRMRPTGSVIHLLLLGSLRVLRVPGLSRDAHLLGPISIAGQSGLGGVAPGARTKSQIDAVECLPFPRGMLGPEHAIVSALLLGQRLGVVILSDSIVSNHVFPVCVFPSFSFCWHFHRYLRKK